VVLFGSDYWSGLIDWLRRKPLEEHQISPPDMDIFTLTDDVDEAAETILARHQARIDAERSQQATEHALKKAAAE
jgi:predicted Rossmann-fold nucleotide-binding protein